MPLNPEWYETRYVGQRYEDDEEEPHEVSIAQIIYEHTGQYCPGICTALMMRSAH